MTSLDPASADRKQRLCAFTKRHETEETEETHPLGSRPGRGVNPAAVTGGQTGHYLNKPCWMHAFTPGISLLLLRTQYLQVQKDLKL